MRTVRVFSDDYRRRIVAECDAAPRGRTEPILRREGLYSSYLTYWRRQFRGERRPDMLTAENPTHCECGVSLDVHEALPDPGPFKSWRQEHLAPQSVAAQGLLRNWSAIQSAWFHPGRPK